ncbi:VapE domain-containing protein [uncultured Bacteroides sp.]|uniref:VapE domain-containing protein n=1 Tax=uncultured Bacteroides sp. TaxID=162156 RepID=UPI002AA63D46|nr:VapE domain-containing protein [uncultured Bacteroides sp.]
MRNIISPKNYFGSLPEWDGTDHLTLFINRVQTTNQELWTETLTRWLCGIVKSELYGRQDNAFVPLICGEQCTGKTTFTRSILPPPLRIYYSEEPIGKYGKEITPPRGYIMVHGTDMECPILYEAKCYKEMYGKRKKGTRIPSVIYTTSWDQQECCEPFIFFEITRSIDNESPVNYEQLYAQIIQKLKDE